MRIHNCILFATIFLSLLPGMATADGSLQASTLLGGGDGESFTKSMAVADDGTIYFGGLTLSSDFPVTAGAYDTTANGDGDVFIAHMSADLSTLLECTYIGGSGMEGDWDGVLTALDDAGNVYVTAISSSPDFPVTTGAYDTTHNGGDDLVVVKMSADLATLIASTYLGGSEKEFVEDLIIDRNGNVCLVGNSTSENYPITAGVYGTVYGGGAVNFGDAVVTRLTGDLSSVIASTYIGGSGGESIGGVAMDAFGRLFVTGYTWSTNFPTTAGVFDSTSQAGADIFLARLDTNLTTLQAATYLGGSSDEYGLCLALATDGSVFVGGHTASTDFPVNPDAFDTTYSSALGAGFGDDICAAHLDADLTTLLGCTYIGGRKWEEANSIVLDNHGNLYLTGGTRSPNMPATQCAYDENYNGGTANWARDAYLAKIDTGLTTLFACTYFGGTSNEGASAIALDNDGNVYIAGNTESTDFPVTTGAYDEILNDGITVSSDIFVCRFDSLMLALPTSVEEAVPAVRSLSLVNRPNPFNPSTTIGFTLPETSHINLSVFDINGRLVRILIDETFPHGFHSLEWDGTDSSGHPVRSGVYFSRLEIPSGVESNKMVLLK